MDDAVVLFLDLLGTAGRSGSDGLDQLRRTKTAVERSLDLAGNPTDSGLYGMSWFSDNLGMHYFTDGEATAALGNLVDDVSFLQLAFLQEQLIARGAVARGLYYSDERFIYGPALERAVALEKTRAKYPRVVLDEASIAVATYGLVHEEAGNYRSSWRSQLWVDTDDGAVFVNYLEKLDDEIYADEFAVDLLAQHRDFIIRNLHSTDGVVGVEAKYQWLAGYHNRYLRELPEELAVPLTVPCSRPIGNFVPFGKHVKEGLPSQLPPRLGAPDPLDEADPA